MPVHYDGTPAQVRALDAFYVYHLASAVGREDAVELLQLASPDQVQRFVDLDGWRRDAVLHDKVLGWLALYVELDDDDFLALARDLDPEVLALLFKRYTEVYFTRDEEGEVNPVLAHLGNYEESPDGTYAIVYDDEADEDATRVLRKVVERLFAVDLVLAHAVLEATRWELSSEMQEAAYQLRRGRLEEMGFVGFEEALEVYAWLDPEAYKTSAVAPQPRVPEGFLLPAIYRASPQDFLSRCAALLPEVAGPDGRTSAQLEFALAMTTNKVLSADAVDPSNRSAVQRAVTRTRGHISLALEYLAGRDERRGAELLASSRLEDLFRVGYSLLLKLQKTARQLLTSERVADQLTLVDDQPLSMLRPDERLMSASVALCSTSSNSSFDTPWAAQCCTLPCGSSSRCAKATKPRSS